MQREQVTDSVIFAGPVPWEDLPAYYDAGTIFAMPCRTRRRGLDVEGLGIVYLEASATGLPVISGDSGGAPDAVLPGETGYVVGGRDEAALAERLIQLLADPQGAATMGEKGLAWVDREWRWDIVAGRLAEILANVGSAAGVEQLDLPRVVLGYDAALDLQRRGEVAAGLGEVGAQDPELPDRLGPGDRLVGVVHRRLQLGDEVRIIGQVGGRRRRPPCRAAASRTRGPRCPA